MGAGNIRVTPDELIDASKKYQTESHEIDLMIGRLDTLIGHLNQIWEGASSDAFHDQYEQLKPSFKDMSNLLEDVHQQLDKAANIMRDTDNQIASQIRG
ncbi:WXG100 family type VII secretion target [Bacillus sp. OV322]|uniref:WXG100 family type VII secretion target n=1 Tax=unclassified Bacillus (in: firmicutes) TaxID=185979 RepID=UPI0008F3DB78|nr:MULTISPECIES: WXG100 family type VII secretion target [unclassified Bacillus (in: firmicutes)]OIK13520.1 hypothetical protein BIV59_05475 [Bacillus sp. MUM 13]SFD00252.1 WXG100 family type VII secretion target [Bacillus sp. OV322]